MFQITFSDGTVQKCPHPITGEELLRTFPVKSAAQIVAWHVNSFLRPLSWTVDSDAEVDWVDLTSMEGMNVYQSSLSFLLVMAADRVLGRQIVVTNSISEGLFWIVGQRETDGVKDKSIPEITAEQTDQIKAEMMRMVAEDIPFKAELTPVDRAIQYFRSVGRLSKAKLLGIKMSTEPVELAACGQYRDMYYSPLVPSTRYLKRFELSRLSPGVVLRFPTTLTPEKLPPYHPSKNLQKVFLEYAAWMRKLKVVNMVQIWDAVARDGGRELILVSEALHARQIADICSEFLSVPDHRVITIAGPSASGKTTTSHKLRVQLQVAEKRPVTLSLDDYFYDRDKSPRDADGNPDFECLEALDLPQLSDNLRDLLAGKTVQVPRFNFYTGRSTPGRTLKLGKDDVIIIEGLHGLNDEIINMIPRERRFGIFLCPMTGINLDRHTRTSTTDHRLLRRMIRDYSTRGNSPEETLASWPSVVRGAMKHVFPFQKNADAIFNSSLLYELPVMRVKAEILLRSVPDTSPFYGEALRLLRILRDVPIIDPNYVPSNSLMREFIGGSIIEL
ncbi:MAG: nucleoside kinase [Pyramidobacter sp.]|jgi:uridine kinase